MSPLFARTAFRLQERLLGRPTFAILRELNESQHWPRERLEQLQLERLRRLLAVAREQTPFWREVIDGAGVAPESVRTLDDLRRLPLLDKATVRARREEMVFRGDGPRLTMVRTSGSTNEALQFYTNSHREAQINAARIRGHRWIGVERGEREMYFWGCPIELNNHDRIKRVRDRLINDGLTNGFALKPPRVAEYYRYWRRWRPKCIFGYPNSLTMMVLMARSLGLDLSALRRRGLAVICTTSEMLTEADRRIIAEGFGVPVYDSYGLREGGLVGHECREGTMHTVDEQILLETIDPVTLKPTDGEGELVLTNLVGTVMPMIRYRTGDIVTLSTAPCRCGLALGSVKISGGRVADFVVTTDGTWIPGYAFIYICRSVPGIVKFQVRQDCPGAVRVLLVTDRSFPADGIEQVRGQFLARLQSKDAVDVERVADIRPAPSGKYRPVVSQVAQSLRSAAEGQAAASP